MFRRLLTAPFLLAGGLLGLVVGIATVIGPIGLIFLILAGAWANLVTYAVATVAGGIVAIVLWLLGVVLWDGDLRERMFRD